ncbi:MAG: acylneuraminate cytidylyltransferase family protein [Nanoarchaeota archaeon]|nr:acylneuraminate cytidylyltransferase family protein [Nanoarchaeota archaeon]
MSKNVVIIPARAGSKGVKKKNFRSFGGKPLIQWSIDVAKMTKEVDEIIVTTDDDDIMGLCDSIGCRYIKRPENLASDTASTLDVLRHAVEQLEFTPSYVILIQPTTPFRTPEQLSKAISSFQKSGFDSLMSISPVPKHYSPVWQKSLGENNRVLSIDGTVIHDDTNATRKQDLPITYWKNGSIYITKTDVLMGVGLFGNSTYGFVIDDEFQVNIDTEFDFFLGEAILDYKRRLSD